MATNLNPLNAELNPICHLLVLLGAHHIFHVSGLRVNKNPEYKVLCKSVRWKSLCSMRTDRERERERERERDRQTEKQARKDKKT